MFDVMENATQKEKKRFLAAILKADEAQNAEKAGDFAQAIALYRQAIEICPPCETRGDYQVLLGDHLFDQGDAAGAEAVFRSAIAGEASYPYEAFRRLAFALGAQGKFDEAIGALGRAIDLGEDFAFATQSAAVYMIARNRMQNAVDAVAPQAARAESDPDFHRRLVMVRAELARLAGDTAGLQLALDTAATLRAHDDSEMDGDVALWLAVLDRISGRDDLRPEVLSAFDDTPPHWPRLAWDVIDGRNSSENLSSALEGESWTRRAEILSQYRRLAGLLAEKDGDVAVARNHYRAARSEPFTQWRLDYHLAGIGLGRLGAA